MCSNGVTTGWDGTNCPGLLCMGTSPLNYGSPPRASGCQTSYWRTSECNPHIYKTFGLSQWATHTHSLSNFSHWHPHMTASSNWLRKLNLHCVAYNSEYKSKKNEHSREFCFLLMAFLFDIWLHNMILRALCLLSWYPVLFAYRRMMS